MPVMMSVSTFRVIIWLARSKISAMPKSVVTQSAIAETVFIIVAGSEARTFLMTSEKTMRWFAARNLSPSP